MSGNTRRAADELRHWGLVWSVVAPMELRQKAWTALQLPATEEGAAFLGPEFVETFVTGSPAPPVPLYLSTLDSSAREALARAASFLRLHSVAGGLPPDHLGPASEIIATALHDGQIILVGELVSRYFLPWCNHGLSRVNAPLTQTKLLHHFRAALATSL